MIRNLKSLSLGLIVLSTLTGCGGLLPSQSASKPTELAMCVALIPDQIQLTFANPPNPPNPPKLPKFLAISLNGGIASYDTCGPADLKIDQQFTWAINASPQSSQIQISLYLNGGSPLRSNYFGTALGSAPIRSDLSFTISGRDSCSDSLTELVTKSGVQIPWHLNAANGCHGDFYDGPISF